MDLLEMLTVFKRHPFLTALGVVTAVIAVLTVSYKIVPATSTSRASIAPRSYTTSTMRMQLMVVDSQFNVGRASTEDRTWDAYSSTIRLAKTYASLLTSDMIRQAASDEVGGLRTSATAQSLADSPIIEFTIVGQDAKRVRDEGVALSDALSRYLTSQQEAHNVPEEERTSVIMLSSTQPVVVEQSRSWEIMLLAAFAPLMLAGGMGLLLERGRSGKIPPEDSVLD